MRLSCLSRIERSRRLHRVENYSQRCHDLIRPRFAGRAQRRESWGVSALESISLCTHSFNTWRAQTCSQLAWPVRKLFHARRADFFEMIGANDGAQSAMPAATRAPNGPRSHFSQGSVKVRLRCDTTSSGSISERGNEQCLRPFSVAPFGIREVQREFHHGVIEKWHAEFETFRMLIQSTSRSRTLTMYDRNSSHEIPDPPSILIASRAAPSIHARHGDSRHASSPSESSSAA